MGFITGEGGRTWWLVGGAVCCVALLDQITKATVDAVIEPNPGHAGKERTFFYFTHERNPGLIGGLFRDSPVIVKTAPVLATLILFYLYRHLEPGSKVQAVAFGLIAGGAVGNLIDRFVRGTVVDFLQFNFYFIPDFFHLPTKRYPAFNVADSAICIGVAALIYTWHRMGKKPPTNAAHPD